MTSASRQSGFSMIELMISITVVAIGSLTISSSLITTTESSRVLAEDQLLRDQAEEIASRIGGLRFGKNLEAPTAGQVVGALAPGLLESADLADEGLTGGAFGPPPTLSQFLALGEIAWQYDDRDVDTVLGALATEESLSSDSVARLERRRSKKAKAKKRRVAVATKSPWRVRFGHDVDDNGVVAGERESSGDLIVIEVYFGDRRLKRMVRSRDAEEI
jgi:prepilin-type N-terminal cleavage/methylation domain-containing protein